MSKWRSVNVNMECLKVLDEVKQKLQKDLGVPMSYSQVLQFLTNEYLKRNK